MCTRSLLRLLFEGQTSCVALIGSHWHDCTVTQSRKCAISCKWPVWPVNSESINFIPNKTNTQFSNRCGDRASATQFIRFSSTIKFKKPTKQTPKQTSYVHVKLAAIVVKMWSVENCFDFNQTTLFYISQLIQMRQNDTPQLLCASQGFIIKRLIPMVQNHKVSYTSAVLLFVWEGIEHFLSLPKSTVPNHRSVNLDNTTHRSFQTTHREGNIQMCPSIVPRKCDLTKKIKVKTCTFQQAQFFLCCVIWNTIYCLCTGICNAQQNQRLDCKNYNASLHKENKQSTGMMNVFHQITRLRACERGVESNEQNPPRSIFTWEAKRHRRKNPSHLMRMPDLASRSQPFVSKLKCERHCRRLLLSAAAVTTHFTRSKVIRNHKQANATSKSQNDHIFLRLHPPLRVESLDLKKNGLCP